MTKALAKSSELERGIAVAKTSREANYFRTRIAALQKLIPKRRETFVDAFDAATVYLKASIKAGELWATMDGKRPAGGIAEKTAMLVRAADVGFADTKDASVCARVAQAAADGQLDGYLEDCRTKNTVPTLGGFYSIWKDHARTEDVELGDVPAGTFAVIVMDPPWAYEARPEDLTHRARNPYPSMTSEQIQAEPVAVKLAPDSILWLWTTNAFMHDALHLLEGWSVEAKTILTWAKPKMGLGDWLRGQTEHCILAVRGRPQHTLTNQTTLLTAPSREHSRKPDEFYALVEATCPGPKLDWFSREVRPGWEQYGNQIEHFVA